MESNNTSCVAKNDIPSNYGLLYFRCVLAIISAICIFFMLSIIILFKKYHFFTQRLILYLAIAALTYQVLSAMDVTSVKAYSNRSALHYCIVIGFLTQVILWWPLMATAVITFDIFVRVVLKKSTERLEIPYVLLIFGLSLLINWIPFVDSAYGPTQYFCWIKDQILEEDCKEYVNGVIYRSALYFAPCYLVAIVMTILLTTTAVFLRQLKKSNIGKFDPQAKQQQQMMEKEIRPMLYYPVIFIVSIFFSALLTLYSAFAPDSEIGYVIIAVMNSTVFRLQGVLITLVFTLDPETRKKLKIMEIKGAFMNFFMKEKNHEYEAKYNARSDSLANSNSVIIQ